MLLALSMPALTTGNRRFTECRKFCRVYFIGHSTKTVFAECQIKYTRQKNTRQRWLCRVFFSALGKDVFCRVSFFGTRQNASLLSAFFWHSAKMYFAECHFLALGKMRLYRVSFFGTRQRGILPCAFFFLPSANYFFKAIFETLNEFK